MEIWTQVFTRHVARLENRDLLGISQVSSNRRSGGARVQGGGLVGSPRCSRMAPLASPAGRTARMRMLPPQVSQTKDIDGEHALEQVGPGEPTARVGWG
jgi:hypothetical protein